MPEVRKRRIRQNGEHLKARILLQSLLLTLDDRLVLHEPLDETVQQRARDLGVFTLEVIQVGPEEVGATLGFRSHELTVAIFTGTGEIAFRRTLPRRGEQRLHGE